MLSPLQRVSIYHVVAGGLEEAQKRSSVRWKLPLPDIKSIDPNRLAPIGEGRSTAGHASAQPGTSQGHRKGCSTECSHVPTSRTQWKCEANQAIERKVLSIAQCSFSRVLAFLWTVPQLVNFGSGFHTVPWSVHGQRRGS